MIVADRLRYTVRKRGKLFWQPTPEMRALGFQAMPLGPDSEASRAKAKALAESWDEVRAGGGQKPKYPPGTFGSYWEHLRGTKEHPSEWWRAKGARTREDYERGWRYIDEWAPPREKGKDPPPTLSRTLITAVTTELCEKFYAHLAGRPGDPAKGIPPVPGAVSEYERWRAIKALKILLKDAVTRLRLGYDSPAKNLVNPQPAGRALIWLGAQVEELACVAAIAGFEGMSLAIDTAWETMFSPVDVRKLRPSQLKTDGAGWYVTGRRGKTQVEFFAALPDDLAARLLVYIERQGRAEADDTPIFRTRDLVPGNAGGRPWVSTHYKTKDLFAKDFRLVREILFPDDTRQLLDIRRSANVEADAAGADKETMGELLANGLADSKFLEATYTPPTVAKAREVAQQRLQGRVKLAGEVTRLRSVK